MSEISFNITIDKTNETVTIINNGTDLVALGISTLTLYMRGEDKNSYIVKQELNYDAFNGIGDEFTYTELFGVNPPPDNFYLCEIIGNETDEPNIVYSEKIAVGLTYEIAEKVHNSTLGVHIPVEDLYTSVTLAAMPQSLEYMEVLSTNTTYSEDREVKWRKLYNYLNIVVNGLDY